MIKKTLILVMALFSSFIVNDYMIEKIEEKYLPAFDLQEIECLALNIYKEARGESTSGMIAVAFVTMNRAQSGIFPSTICEVVYQKQNNVCQFSWVCMKDIYHRQVNSQTYEYIKNLATFVYLNKNNVTDVSNGALFYHADYVKPIWRKSMQVTAKIGRHIFYKI